MVRGESTATSSTTSASPRSGLGPLHGVRVLELGSFIAGPFAGQLLGDYGAEVLKIEPPDGGDPMRTWGITHEGESLWWPAIARNKRSVAVDMRNERGRAVVRRLAGHVDVVLENFRPGRLDEWGLGYAQLSIDNPGLVMVHVSGFGQSGPRAAEAGFGSIGEAVGGIRFTTGNPDATPARSGISLGDSLAAMFAVIGTMAALTERSRSGVGQEVDVAIYEAVAALMESTMADFEIAGHLRTRTGSVLPGVAPSNVYPSADGGSVILAANADAVFRRLCGAMGRPELAGDPRYATHGKRGDNMAELDALISTWTATLAATELLATLAAHGVPAGEIFTAENMLADPHYAEREMVVRREHRPGTTVPMTGVVPKFSRTPGSITTTGPRLGQHTRAVMHDLLGMDDAEYRTLVEDDVLGEETLSQTLPQSVEIVEVGPRDGLQDEHEIVSTADKIAYVDAVLRAGVRRVEVASFVDPRRVPQMADAEAVIAGLRGREAGLIGLVLNERGMDRALASGIGEINMVVAVTDTFGERNSGMTTDVAAQMWAAVAARAHANGIRAVATLSVAFGCPYDGRVAADHVVALARRVADAGPYEISLADTIGSAVPNQTEDLVAAVVAATGTRVRCHFHNSRNTGLANALGALAGGAVALDSSTGGIGGCPFAPGATGNIATEDLVHMLHGMGIATGIDLPLLLEAVAHVEAITGHPSVGMLAKAGIFPRRV